MAAGRTVRCVECAGVRARSIVPRAECGQRSEGPSMAAGRTVCCVGSAAVRGRSRWARVVRGCLSIAAGGMVYCGRSD